ncbi:MAG: DUF2442 domain-containing protein [Mesorhizobium sp.]
MTILTLANEPLVTDVRFSDATLGVTLEDGREISVPIDWFPRLRNANAAQRQNWRLIGRGEGIHWPDIDEDISAYGLLAGYTSPKPGSARSA